MRVLSTIIYIRVIRTWDITLNHVNSGFASQYSLPFSLSNGLQNNSYLKIVFPYSLHQSSSSQSQPIGMDASYAKVLHIEKMFIR